MAEKTDIEDDDSTSTDGETKPALSRVAIAGLAALGIAGVSSVALMAPPDTDTLDARPARLPASDEQVRPPVGPPPVPSTTSGDVDFIVRFDDIPEIEECLATFRQDPAHARTVFRNWARDYPALSGFSLKKTNYSGELVLTWTGPGEPPSRSRIMDVKDRLQSMSAVKYADPDYSAKIEEDPR